MRAPFLGLYRPEIHLYFRADPPRHPGHSSIPPRSTGRPCAPSFKVSSLRNVAVTTPYGHPNTDPAIHPLELSAREKADLVAFLRALIDEVFLEEPRFQPGR